MRVTVLLPGVLRDKAEDQARFDVEVPEPATLGALLDVLAERYPALERRLRDERTTLRRYVNFYVDGEECRFSGGAETKLQNGGEVQIIPSVAGG
jgi:sulfur-carrier protein